MKNAFVPAALLITSSLLIDSVASLVYQSLQLHPTAPRITGGNPAQRDEFPWIISIQYQEDGDWKHDCGGAIMDPNHIITAGHCVWNRNPKEIEVVAGAHNIKEKESTQQRRKPDKFFVHPNYTTGDGPGPFDIAIIRLSKPFKFGKHVNKIEVAKCNEGPVRGEKCSFAGWGNLFPVSPLFYRGSDVLITEPTTIISLKECKEAYSMYSKALVTALCSRSGLLHGTCQGDSGGPLTCYKGKKKNVPYLAGVVSFGFPVCNDGYHPDVYTNVANSQICKYFSEYEQLDAEKSRIVWMD